MLLLQPVVAIAQRADCVDSVTARRSRRPVTVDQLRDRLSAMLREPEMAVSSVSMRLQLKSTGQIFYEHDPERLLVPASNLKLYTTAAALDLLGSDYRIRTSVLSRSRPDGLGRVADLVLYGRGDPAFGSRFNENVDPFALIIRQLQDAGVRTIEGDLIADESYFRGVSLGQGWEWTDIQWPYGSQVSALTVSDNSVDVHVRPSNPGEYATITITPNVGYMRVQNLCNTVSRREKREIGMHRGLENNLLLVWGQIPVDDPGFQSRISVYQPARFAAVLFKAALERAGIKVKGGIKVADSSLTSEAAPTDPERMVELAYVDSPPLRELVRIINKFSNNLYAEQVLRVLGRQKGSVLLDSDAAGLEVVRAWLKGAGLKEPVVLYDGSGLARRSLTSAAALTSLLRYISARPVAKDFEASLPISGEDGTLSHRTSGTDAERRVRAKTGTLVNVSSLSGFITTAYGEELVFSIIVNNHPGGQQKMRAFQDEVCRMLAAFECRLGGSR